MRRNLSLVTGLLLLVLVLVLLATPQRSPPRSVQI